MPIDRKERAFIQFGQLTVILIYLVILAGGIVRATGSGMGCPDWPKCFDRWVPPTKVEELPANYQIIYAERGYASTEFNAVKTWIEYVNRLLGVLVGFSIFLFLSFSFYFYKRSKLTVFLAFVSFLLVSFQGWLGSMVVSSLLSEWMITLHMLVALVIVLLVLFTVAYTRLKLNLQPSRGFTQVKPELMVFGYILLLVLLLQVLMGTQVREEVDGLAKAGVLRTAWIDELGAFFQVHRVMGMAILVMVVFWLRAVDLNQKSGWLSVSGLIYISLSIELLAGLFLAYMDFPAFMQPMHLLMGTVLIGLAGFKMATLQLNTIINR